MDEIEEKSFVASAVETLKTIVYALLIAGVFRTLFFQPFWIPSGSMKDTLLIGDFLFVNKMAYGYSYASCPKIQIPRFGVNIDADDLIGLIATWCRFDRQVHHQLLDGTYRLTCVLYENEPRI